MESAYILKLILVVFCWFQHLLLSFWCKSFFITIRKFFSISCAITAASQNSPPSIPSAFKPEGSEPPFFLNAALLIGLHKYFHILLYVHMRFLKTFRLHDLHFVNLTVFCKEAVRHCHLWENTFGSLFFSSFCGLFPLPFLTITSNIFYTSVTFLVFWCGPGGFAFSKPQK